MCTFIHESSWSYVLDTMKDLSAIPQEKIVDYLLERLEQGQIYTWVGTLLLAVNPNGEINTEKICDPSRAHEYDNICDVAYKEVSPHIFAVAARAHYRIIQNLGKPSQVIILNGETGTGKTFNAWKALEFLTGNIFSYTRDRPDVVCGIVRRISDVCQLISAFTTAPTERNRASSRHVQLVWLEYKMGGMCGAKISSYLLERDRVTKGCCNFQIFGQMMSAVASMEFADTKLSMDRRYSILSDLNSQKVQELHDSFQGTLKVMSMLGLRENQKKDIFLILSLLIHMGDIDFVQEDDHCIINTSNQQFREALENTCRLTCIEENDIVELLTSTSIIPQNTRHRHTTCRRNLTTRNACRYRLYSIIRHLYDLLFHWLIDYVNEILSARLYSERLGILDIFGFECFDSNGIEQLSINYVNERLQQYFIEKYLISCRNDLQKEGLIDDEEPLDIVQLYKHRIDTIEKCLFTPLNDMCLSTVLNNSFVLMRQVCANSCPETRRFLNVKDENFVIRHYNGAVGYFAHDLLSKNTDKIPDEMIMTFTMSKNNFLRSLINRSKPCHDGKTKRSTMLSKLRYNVDLLIEELDKCDPHYVRCIKPQRLNSKQWDRDDFYKQLVNTGILEAIPLARCKYPIQFPYKAFFKRYYGKRAETCSLLTACKNILESFHLTVDNDGPPVYYGKRLIFLRESVFLQLESARKQYHVECVKKIESFWIKYKRYKQDSEEKNEVNICSIADINIQNKLELNLCKEDQPQDLKDSSQAIVPFNDQPKILQTEYKLMEYENMLLKELEDQTKYFCAELLLKVVEKTAYLLHWLDDMIKTTDTKNMKLSILQQLQDSYHITLDINHKEKVQSRYISNKLSNNKFRTRNINEKIGYYNKKEDMYIIQLGTSTLYYKNRILSRRRLAKVPIKMNVHQRCLTNSHYLVHTELPQGLQDCL